MNTTDAPLPSAQKRDVLAGPNPYGFAILIGLSRLKPNFYQGTVSPAEKARRRAAGRRAKAARKITRKAA